MPPVDPSTGPAPLARRRFIGLAAAAGAATMVGPVAGCSSDESSGPLPAPGPDTSGPGSSVAGSGTPPAGAAPVGRFPDGVMAGDPRPRGAAIWTRVGDLGRGSVELVWEVADDDGFDPVVAGGTVVAEPGRDGAVTVAVDGLEPDRWYRYRFVAPDGAGPIGRLRTAPDPSASPGRLRFAWCSCQQINDSLYVAHRAMAAEEGLDFFVHLGDYVYVSDDDTVTVDDYRAVYHRFKANPLLQQLQATAPIVAMFDDGEFYNGVDAQGDPVRLAAAHQAWVEAFPFRAELAEDRYERTLRWGDLADLFVLDVRSHRDPAIEETDSATPAGAEMFAADRTTLGADQKQWLLDGLRSSSAAWRFLGNPYNMASARFEDRDPGPPRPEGTQVNGGNYFPNEAWDDYQAERRQILDTLAVDGIRDVVSVSGHTHVWLAGAMAPDPDDPASPVVAFDFTCGSLTADPDVLASDDATPRDELRERQRALATAGLAINPHLRYINFVDQGYGLVTVTPEQAVIEFKLVDPFDEAAEAKVGARFVLARGATDLSVERFADAER